MTRKRTSPRKVLARALSRINEITQMLVAIRQDVSKMGDRSESLVFCIDFSWLYRYVALDTVLSERDAITPPTYDQFVLGLSFHKGPGPLVLLPDYFEEFESHLRRLAGRPGTVSTPEDFRLGLLDQLRHRVTGALSHLSELLNGSLSEQQPTAASLDVVRNALLDLAKEGRMIFRSATQLVVWIQRFDQLLEAGRIAGIRSISDLKIADEPLLPREDVFARALSFLDAWRDDKSEGNRHDARALAMVAAANGRLSGKEVELVLVSDAFSLIKAAEHVSKNEDITGVRLRVRTSYYWMWWFGALARSPAGATIPSLGALDELAEQLGGLFNKIGARGKRMAEQIDGDSVPTDVVSEALREADVDLIARQVEDAVEQTCRPLLGDSWLAGEVHSMFDSVFRDSDIGPRVERLLEVLERCEIKGDEVDGLRTQLEAVMLAIEQFIAAFRSRVSQKDLRASDIQREFVEAETAFELEALPLDIRPIVADLELRGAEAIDDVIKKSNELRQQGIPLEIWAVLRMRALMVGGRFSEARRVFDDGGLVLQDQPNAALIGVELYIEAGDLEKAGGLLRHLRDRFHDEPLVLLHESWLLEVEGRTEEASKALVGAWRGSEGRARAVRIRVAEGLVRFGIRRARREAAVAEEVLHYLQNLSATGPKVPGSVLEKIVALTREYLDLPE